MDCMYLKLERSTQAFVTIIDAFSKYAYTRMYQLPKTSQALKSSQTLAVLEDFLDHIDDDFGVKRDEISITFDAGKEFLGDVLEYVNEEKILHSFGQSGHKKKMPIVERFNRTLRLYIEKYRLIHGRVDSNALKKILQSYNNVPHAGLKYSPIEIIKNKEAALITAKHFDQKE